MTNETTSGISRRTLAKGAAWAVPAVAVAAATPAMAQSGSVTFTDLNTSCKLPGASCEDETGIKWGYVVAMKVCNTVTGDPGSVVVSLPATITGTKCGDEYTWNLTPQTLNLDPGGCDVVYFYLQEASESANCELTGSADFTWTAQNGLSGSGTLSFSTPDSPVCKVKLPGDNNACYPTIPTT